MKQANCKVGKWLRICHSSSSYYCECSAIYDEHHVSLPPRQIIAVIHQNPTKRQVLSITIRSGRQSHGDGGSVSESCQNGGERGSERPTKGENKQKIRSGGNGLSTPIYEQCPERSMFGLLMTCTDWEGVGRCSSNTTCHISQPRQLHNRERFTLIMKSFAC